MQKRVSIQGYPGSFHEQAAQQYYGRDVEIIPCDTFREVVQWAANPQVSVGGVMAIENSIAGSILANYNLLAGGNVSIVGEVYLKIRQHLLVNPGVTLADIKEVHSHPMALLQCSDYLHRRSWKLIESEDTALSAKHLQQHRNKHRAAVAGKLAAELYGLEILVPDIHTMKKNYTRFLMLAPRQQTSGFLKGNKASVCFHTDHAQGSLAKVLTAIAKEGVNLSKLQSMPIAGTRFQYAFYADMEFAEISQFETVLKKINPLTQEVRVYGVYQSGLIQS